MRAEGGLLGERAVLDLTSVLAAEIHGLGPLQQLLEDESVTDVLVNGASDVWVDRGEGLERSSVHFRDEGQVRALAQRVAARCGRRLDDASPWVDARLPDGTRVHAVLPPVSASTTLISVRVVRRRAFTLDELVALGSVPPLGAQWLQALVSARVAFVLSGGTGTGKTTVLSTLLASVDPAERIVIVEDAAELRPDHPHVVRLEARTANIEGVGVADLRTLVRQALRMRPDRLVVGEARGAEVADLLAAMNTGHEGGCATVHANSAADVPARFEALGLLAGLSREALHSQVASALDAVVHLVRDRSGRRRIAGIAVVERNSDGSTVAVPAVVFGAQGMVEAGPGEASLRRRIERSS